MRGLEPSRNNRAVRLAAVALAWNVLQHFYPYFDVVAADWPAALKEALKAAATDPDRRAFLRTLQKLIASLHDGHGQVSHPGEAAAYTLPVTWDWIEDHLVITAVSSQTSLDLAPGDIVTKIGGRPVLEALQDEETRISAATPQWRRFRAVRSLAAGRRYTGVDIEVPKATGEPYSVGLLRTLRGTGFEPVQLPKRRPAPIDEIEPGIVYVNLDRVTDTEFTAALPRLQQADGIVFDLRGYRATQPPYAIPISHLIDEPVDSPRWLHPEVTRPDRADMQFHRSNWTILPREPRLRAKAVYITNARAISAAETHMAIIEHYKIAPIVGGPTAGTNGDVNPFTLPGGFRVGWTGLRVVKHDGSRFHGVGVNPTIPCSRTIEGVRAGRDELLERAVSIVRP